MSVRLSVVTLAMAVVASACDETGPLDVRVPAVIFVSGEQQDAELYLLRGDTLTRLTSNASGDG